MAKDLKKLVIVESPAKARKIGGYLGDDYIVEASVGHIRDLPQRAADIPKEYKKIAWIDPDLEFNNKNWYRDTSKKLNSYKLVQMYSMGLSTDKYGREQRLHPGIMSMYGKVSESDWFNHPGHPGGAWGARRELWKFAGLYPFALMGGGDTVFIYTIFGYDFSHTAYKNIGISGNRIFQHYSKWRNDIQNYVNKNVSFIDGDFIHEWNGNKPRT